MSDQEELRLVITGEDRSGPALQQYQASLGQAQAATQAFGQASAATAGQHAQATTAVTGLGGAVAGLEAPVQQSTGAFATFRAELAQHPTIYAAIGVAAAAAGAAIGAGLAAAAHEAAQYQRALADVNVVTGASAEQMAQFNHLALELGASTQFNSKQVAQAFYEEASAGLTVSETLAATTHVIDAATLGHLNLKQATDTVTGVMRTFGLTAQDLGHLVDVETRAIQLSKFHWDDVAEAMRNAGPQAHNVGMSVEETTAALMAMANAGQPAAMAGTAFSTAIQRLITGGGEAGAAIHALGLQLYNAQGHFVGTTEVTRQLEGAFAGMTDQQKQHYEAMLGGARANRLWGSALEASVTIMQGGEEVTLKGSEALKYWEDQLKNSAGTAESASEKIRATLAFQIDNLKGSMGEAAIQLGQQFVPALQQLTPAVQGVVNAFVQADPALQAGTAAFLAASAAALTLAGIATTLGVVLPVAATALAAVGLAVAPVAAALAAVAVASGVLAAAWVGDWGNIRETTASVGAELGLFFQAFGNNIDKAIADIKTKGPAVRAALVDLFHPATNAEGQTNDPLLDLVLKGLNQLGEKGAEAAQAAGAKIKQNEIDALSPQDFANYYKSQLDATAQQEAGAWDRLAQQVATAQFRSGATMKEEATKALMASLPEGTVNDEAFRAQRDALVTRSQEEGRALNLAYRAIGSTSGLALAEGLASAAPDVEAAANDLLGKAKGDYKKAITEGLKEGVSTEVIQALLEGERAAAGFQSVLKTLTDAQGAAALESEHLHGPLTALHELLDAGTISTEQYTEAIHGQVKAHGAGASAAQQHKAALDALLASTDANQVKQGLWQQQTEQFVSSALPHLTAEVAAQAKAFENAGDDMGALNTVAAGFHITTNELLALIQNGTAATELWGKAHLGAAGAAAGETTAVTGLTAAHRELAKSTDATVLAADFLEQRYASLVSSALPHLSAELAGQVQAQENANGAQSAANLLYAQGAITQEQYAAATDGAEATTKRHTKAVDEHKQALDEMLKSTDAATVATGQLEQRMDSFVNGALSTIPPALAAQVTALRNAGDAEGAYALLADQAGLSTEQLTARLEHHASATDLLGTAQQRHAGLLKEELAAMDAAAVGAGLYEQRLESTVHGALSQMPVALAAQVQALENAGDRMAAAQIVAGYYGVALQTLQAAAEGDTDAHNRLTEAVQRTTNAHKEGAAAAELHALTTKKVNDEENRLAQQVLNGSLSTAQMDKAMADFRAKLATANVGNGLNSPFNAGLVGVGQPLMAGVAAGIESGTAGAVHAATQAAGAVAGALRLAMPADPFAAGDLFAQLAKEGAFPKSYASKEGAYADPEPYSDGTVMSRQAVEALRQLVEDTSVRRIPEGMGDFGAGITGAPRHLGLGGTYLMPETGMVPAPPGIGDFSPARDSYGPDYGNPYGPGSAPQGAGGNLAGPYVAIGTAAGQAATAQNSLTTATRNSSTALSQAGSTAHTMASAYDAMGASANAAKSASDALAASEAASARARQQNATDLLAGTQTIGGFKVAAPTTTGSSGGTSNSSNLYSSSSTSGWASAYNAYTAGGIPHFATGGHVSRPTLAVVGDAGGETMVPDSQLGRLGGANIFVTLNYSPAVGIANNGEMQRAAQQLAATMKRELARLG